MCLLLFSHYVGFDSLQHRGLKPTTLLCPWHFPGKNTGVGCHFFCQGIFLTQASPALAGGFLPLAPPGKPCKILKISESKLCSGDREKYKLNYTHTYIYKDNISNMYISSYKRLAMKRLSLPQKYFTYWQNV